MLKANRKKVELLIPPKIEGYSSWVVMGFDLSLSRSGWAVAHVAVGVDGTHARVIGTGSVKPDDASLPVWLRGRLIGKGLLQAVQSPEVSQLLESGAGLILSFEAFTPRNDYLSSVRRLVDSVFFSSDSPLIKSSPYLLSINASTLRSIMGLVQKGAGNKKENIIRAYDFIAKSRFPELDSDACDAVLLTMCGRYVVSILSGFPEEVPSKPLTSLCDAKQEVKGKGRNSRIQTKGVLHRGEYWIKYSLQAPYSLCLKDASNPKKSLERITLTV